MKSVLLLACLAALVLAPAAVLGCTNHDSTAGADADEYGGVRIGKTQMPEIVHVLGIHHNGSLQHQMLAYHVCNVFDESNGMTQCLLIESDDQGRKMLTGVEYIVNEATFKSFPDEEKKLWHSHQFEIQNGLVVIGGIMNATRVKLLQSALANSYGKIWNTWDKSLKFPTGLPQLQFSLTAEGQVNSDLLQKIDSMTDMTQAERKQKLSSLQFNPVAPGADVWMNGTVPVLQAKMVSIPRPAATNATAAPIKANATKP